MAVAGTGTVWIPIEEFWEFVTKYMPEDETETRFGVPRVQMNQIEIDYAFSSDGESTDMDAMNEQWRELKGKK